MTVYGGRAQALPQDIWYLIFKEMDFRTAQSAMLHTATIARDSGVSSMEGLVNLSSTCRVMRKWAEPVLFSRLAFDQNRHNRSATFWDTVVKRFDLMLTNKKLKELVKSLEFYCIAPPIKIVARNNFWPKFTLVLIHFSSLESLTLDIPLFYDIDLSLDPCLGPPQYPPPVKRILLRQEDARVLYNNGGQKTIPAPVRLQRFGRLIASCVPCIPPDTSTDEELHNEELEIIAGNKILFSSINQVCLAANTNWLLAHCPNLKTFVSLDAPYTYARRPTLDVLSTQFTALKSLTLDTYAHKSTLEGISQKFPMVDELRLYPPVITGIDFSGPSLPICMLDETELLTIAPVLGSFPNLRYFGLLDLVWKRLFLEDETNTLSMELQRMAQDMGLACTSLQYIYLGRFELHRESRWECPRIT